MGDWDCPVCGHPIRLREMGAWVLAFGDVLCWGCFTWAAALMFERG